MSCKSTLVLIACLSGYAHAQSQTPPNLFNTLSFSSVFNQPVYNANGTVIGTLNSAVPSIYAYGNGNTLSLGDLHSHTLPINAFQVDSSIVAVNNAVNSSVATALGLIPLASPASAVIYPTDANGVPLPAASTLGTVFTERAETIGKNKWFFGVTNQDYNFTQLNGHSLNGLSVLYPGGAQSGLTNIAGANQASTGNLTAYPATFNIGMNVRLSQNVAYVTYGVTNRLDVSLAVPLVHAAVAARTYNGTIYDGDGLHGVTGLTAANPNCWCAGTFNPGAFASTAANFTLPVIGQSSLGKTGIGDVLVRAKETVLQSSHLALAVGADLRFATGDAQNYLGTGTTSVKPFVALSLFSPQVHNIVFAPHINIGYQYSGMSVLGGQLHTNNTLTATMSDGSGTIQYDGAPLTSTKGYLPDVFSWAVGTEVAIGRRNTLIVDVMGNEVGLIHGAPNLVYASEPGYSPTTSEAVNATGFVQPSATTATAPSTPITGPATISYSQFSGAFGYKVRLVGKLVLTVSALVRFDSNGLTARVAPLYSLGYTF